MTKLRGIRLTDEVFEEFKAISTEEGRNYNKVIEILIETYKQSKEESENEKV